MALEHLVRMPLGLVRVVLDRRGMALEERGGFAANWAFETGEALSPESYRRIVKLHLTEVFQREVGREPPRITLNLASHQLMDDLTGWTKLNCPPQR